jgi:hypothetical protein
VIHVVIEELPESSALHNRYFEFRETETFTIVCSAPGCTYAVPIGAEVKASLENIEEIIENFQFSVAFLGQRVELEKPSSEVYEKLRGGYEVKVGDLHWKYAHELLILTGEITIPLSEPEVSVTKAERSVLRRSDKEYVKILTEPARGFRFNFTVPNGHAVKLCYASVDRFAWHPGHKLGHAVEFAEGGSKRHANVNAPWWALPGIAVAVVWTEAPI